MARTCSETTGVSLDNCHKHRVQPLKAAIEDGRWVLIADCMKSSHKSDASLSGERSVVSRVFPLGQTD